MKPHSASATARPPSETSCALHTRPERTSSASRRWSRRSCARSTLGGVPASRPRRRCSHSLPPSSSRVVAEQHDREAVGVEVRDGVAVDVVEQADHRDRRRRVDRAAAGLVVERDVARDHRRAERLGRVAETADRLGQLPHDLRLLGIAEVQAVGERERPRAGARDVARRLGHRRDRAGARIEPAPARVAVDRHRERLARRRAVLALHAHQRGVAAGTDHRVALHQRVVLALDPGLRAEVRRIEQRAAGRPADPTRARSTRGRASGARARSAGTRCGRS